MKRFFTIIFLASFSTCVMYAQADSGSGAETNSNSILNIFKGKKKEPVTITLRDGSVYTGEVRRKRPHGTGCVIYVNGDR